jgi:hypothetical protein
MLIFAMATHFSLALIQVPVWTEDKNQKLALQFLLEDGQQEVSDSLMYIQADNTPTKTGIVASGEGCQTVNSQRQASPLPKSLDSPRAGDPAVHIPFAKREPLPAISEGNDLADGPNQPMGADPDSDQVLLAGEEERSKPKAARGLFGDAAHDKTVTAGPMQEQPVIDITSHQLAGAAQEAVAGAAACGVEQEQTCLVATHERKEDQSHDAASRRHSEAHEGEQYDADQQEAPNLSAKAKHICAHSRKRNAAQQKKQTARGTRKDALKVL